MKKKTAEAIKELLNAERESAKNVLLSEIESGRATVSDRVSEYKEAYGVWYDFLDWYLDNDKELE